VNGKTIQLCGITVLLIAFASCATVSRYDEQSYLQVTACKAEALSLIDKSYTPYKEHLDEIASVKLDVLKAYEYDAGRAQNKLTMQMWDTLLDEKGSTFFGTLELWRVKGQLHPAFVAIKRSQVSQAFNQIVDAESGKVHQ
jgi:hypothetical protein